MNSDVYSEESKKKFSTRGFNTTTEQHSAAELGQWEGNGDGTIVAQFTGICTKHTVIIRHSDMAALYFVTSESGPIGSLVESWGKKKTVQVAIPASTSALGRASNEDAVAVQEHMMKIAMQNALAEVKAEMDVI